MLNKDADTTHSIHPLIKKRYSPRIFSDQLPAKEVLERMFEAARWAPSSMNDQPWHFIVGIKGEGDQYNLIFETLVEFNQKWAYTAPVLVLLCGNTLSAKTGKENRAFRYDCGQAAAFFSIQAMEENIYVHQMGGFDAAKARSFFRLPAELEPLVVLAIGYLGDAELLPAPFYDLEKAKRIRKEQTDFVKW